MKAPVVKGAVSSAGGLRDSEPDDVEMKILRFLLELHDRGQEPFKQAIATGVGIGLAKADYHLNCLEQTGLAKVTATILNQGNRYGLTEDGIAFLVNRGEVK